MLLSFNYASDKLIKYNWIVTRVRFSKKEHFELDFNLEYGSMTLLSNVVSPDSPAFSATFSYPS